MSGPWGSLVGSILFYNIIKAYIEYGVEMNSLELVTFTVLTSDGK